MPANSQEAKELVVGYYNRGKEYLAQNNFDGAISQFKEALLLSPDSIRIRKSLRDTQIARFNGQKQPANTGKVHMTSVMAKINVNRAARRWSEVARLAEDELDSQPLDSTLNSALGEALWELGFADVAWFAYDIALQHDPTNVSLISKISYLMEDLGQVPKALELWQKVKEAKPCDSEVESRLNDLTVKNFMHSSGLNRAGNASDLNAADQKPRTIEGGHVAIKGGTQAEPDETNGEDPVESLMQIADYLVTAARLRDARAVLRAAVEVSNRDKRCVDLFELVNQGVAD